MELSEKKGWTLAAISFEGRQLVGPTGANQAVVNVKPPYQTPSGQWIGTAHGGEEVERTRLRVDGVILPAEKWTGVVTGREKDDRRDLMQDIRWLAVYAEKQGFGAVISYPVPYKGVPGFSNILWNRPRDNKHYLKVDPPRGKGTRVSYQCSIAAFVASPKEWKQAAQKVVTAQSTVTK